MGRRSSSPALLLALLATSSCRTGLIPWLPFADGAAPLDAATVAPPDLALPDLFAPPPDMTRCPGDRFRFAQRAQVQVVAVPVVTGDFDGDGHPDVVAGGWSGNTPGVMVLPGNGDGTLRPPTFLPTSKAVMALVVADFDRDKRLDIAYQDFPVPIQFQGDSLVTVLLGDGKGGVARRVSSPISGQNGLFSHAVVADLDRDGIADIALACLSFDGLLEVAMGAGDGTFRAHGAGEDIWHATTATLGAADFDGDGNVDLVANPTGNTVLVFGDGSGKFPAARAVKFPAPRVSYELTIGDFNHDAHPDLAMQSSDGVVVLLNDGKADFRFSLLPIAGGAASVATVDLDGDGHLDLVSGDRASGDLLLFAGRGDGTFESTTCIPTGKLDQWGGIAVADLTGDGKPDIVAAAGNPRSIIVLRNESP